MSVNNAAMLLHDQGLISLAAQSHQEVVSLAAGGIGSVFGAIGGGALSAVLGLILVSGKVNAKPALHLFLTLMFAGSIAYTGGKLASLNEGVSSILMSANSFGFGQFNPAGVALIAAVVLWCFKLKPLTRFIAAYVAYVAWSSASGTIWTPIIDVVNTLVHQFSG